MINNLKAAYYLIENIKFKYHCEGAAVKLQKKKFDTMDSLFRNGDIITNKSWDSLLSKPNTN